VYNQRVAKVGGLYRGDQGVQRNPNPYLEIFIGHTIVELAED